MTGATFGRYPIGMPKSGECVARRTVVVEGTCVLGLGAYVVGELPVVVRAAEPAKSDDSPVSEKRTCEHIRH